MLSLRPSRPRGAVLVLTALSFAFFGISRTSGAGWATVLVAGVIAAVVSGVLLPAAVLMARTVPISVPAEGTVGSAMDVEIGSRASAVAEIVTFGTQPFRLDRGVLSVHPTQRGVFEHAAVVVRTSAPLGFLEWRRTVIVPFPRPVEIGPRVAAAAVPPARRTHDVGDEDVRGVRPYEPGDTMKSIHWPATARAGALTVRQHDAPVAPNVVIAVDLDLDSAEAVEERASRAAGMARAALDAGAAVVLATCERRGPVTAAVTSASEVNRRLARAVAGPLAIDDVPGIVTL